MKKKKILLLVLLVITILAGIRNLDLMLRYDLSWLDYNKYAMGLTLSEKDYLKENALLVGVYDDPPISFINEFNNRNAGILIDYISQLAIELGNNILLKAGPKETTIEALSSGEVDLIFIEKTPETANTYELTESLCVVKGKIAVKNTSSIESVYDLEGTTLVVLEKDNVNHRITNYFKDRINVTILEVDNMYQCFALMRNEIAVGFVGDDMEMAHYMNVTNTGNNFKVLGQSLYQKTMCLAVNKGNEELLGILNKGILALKQKDLIAQTQRKWLGDFDSDGIDVWQLDLTYKVLSAVMVIIALFSSWNYVITQQVNTKTRELSESKAELRLIIDTLQRGIMVIENNTRIIECNDAVTSLIGIDREMVIGQNYQDIKALQPFVDENNMEVIFNLGNAYYYVTSQEFQNNKRLIMIEDYTDKHIAERRVRQETKMVAVGQLSAGLAHEIRNPLGLIKSYVYVLEKYAINKISKHAVFVINDSVGRINTLIESLLRFSKLSNDEKKPVDVENLIQLMLTLEAKNLEKHAIEVNHRVYGSHVRPIELNEDVLKMILLNLINNSIDSFDGVERWLREINIEVEILETTLNIRLWDNGCGIEKDKLENIFNPFYSTKESGTGLGLYVISTEISNNDGQITVDSEVGKGTEFLIRLPIKG